MSENKNYISMLVYGKAGVGKSIFASTFPKPLVFDFDYGHKMYEAGGVFPDAKYVRGENALSFLASALKQVKDGVFKYETIVIDSVTALENAAINSYKGLNSDNFSDMLYTTRGGKLGYDEWGSISGSTIGLLTMLREYPVNVVAITQVDSYKDGAIEKYKPGLVGRGQDESLHYPDFVMFMENDGESGRIGHLSSKADDYFVAKSRLANKSVSYIKNPSYEKLIALVKETKVDLDFS